MQCQATKLWVIRNIPTHLIGRVLGSLLLRSCGGLATNWRTRPSLSHTFNQTAMVDTLTKQDVIAAHRLLLTYVYARLQDWDAQDRVNVAAGLGDLARLIENDKKLK